MGEHFTHHPNLIVGGAGKGLPVWKEFDIINTGRDEPVTVRLRPTCPGLAAFQVKGKDWDGRVGWTTVSGTSHGLAQDFANQTGIPLQTFEMDVVNNIHRAWNPMRAGWYRVFEAPRKKLGEVTP